MKRKYKVMLIILGIMLFFSVVEEIFESYMEYTLKPIYTSDAVDLVYCKNDIKVGIYFSNNYPDEINSIFDSSDKGLVGYDNMKYVYDIVETVRNPVRKGIYILNSSEKKEIFIVNIQYNPELQKKKGRCIESVSLEDCWGVYYEYD